MIHIEDKPGLFREVIRVLRPGGVFVASDWLSGQGAEAEAALQHFVSVGHLRFTPATAAEMEAILIDAGFDGVSTRDRNAWYAELSAQELQQIEGPLREQLIDAVGEEIYLNWLEVRRGLANATAAGGLRPTHLRGFKSD
jgi:phosphoethanolamine N-methyltransferase